MDRPGSFAHDPRGVGTTSLIPIMGPSGLSARSPVAVARWCARRDASRPADPLEGRSRFDFRSAALGRRDVLPFVGPEQRGAESSKWRSNGPDLAGLSHCRGVPRHAGRIHAGRCRRSASSDPGGWPGRHRARAMGRPVVATDPAGSRDVDRASAAGSCHRAPAPRRGDQRGPVSRGKQRRHFPDARSRNR
jgi:hypothetical protein